MLSSTGPRRSCIAQAISISLRPIGLTTKNHFSQTLLLLAGLVFGYSVSAAENFQQCLQRLQLEATRQGIGTELAAELASIKPLVRTIELDRNQPEFVQTFSGYYKQRVNDYRIDKGRELLDKHAQLLDSLSARYGIPPQYLVSFWGLESNFGRHIGKIPVLDTLVTLACDERRSEFFSGELFAALKLMQNHNIDRQQMAGSWAGAIGQTQFMPTAYLQFGIDGDGDQRVDLWRSEADALTSAAHYLQQLGWQPALRWGREVWLPEDFPYHEAGIDQPRPLAEWHALGVRKTDRGLLAQADIAATLLIPAGSEGPKFLVYDNFHVIMKWNRSQYYALSVGILADRINGAGRLTTPLPVTTPLTKDQVTALQEALAEKGFDPGDIDGQLGPMTYAAIRGFQKEQQLLADGHADSKLLRTVLGK